MCTRTAIQTIPIDIPALDGRQFLIGPSRSIREIENDDGQVVLLAARGGRNDVPARLALLGGAVVFASYSVTARAGFWPGALGLLVACLLALLSSMPRRTYGFLHPRHRTKLFELRPATGLVFWQAAHVVVDEEGALLARIRLEPFGGRWVIMNARGSTICVAGLTPHVASFAGFGRGTFLARYVVLRGTIFNASAVLERRSPQIDRHDLLDFSQDPDGSIDRRIALAVCVLIG